MVTSATDGDLTFNATTNTLYSSNISIGNDLGVTGATTLTGNLSVTAPSTISGYGTIPIGGIIMWSGAIANIPTGWALCNDQTVNGIKTPDLRNKFIVGAGSVYAVAAIGGTADAVVPEHNHSASFSGDNSLSSLIGANQYAGGSGFAIQGGISAAVSGTVTVANAGESGTNKNLPPYYALAFIMRIS